MPRQFLNRWLPKPHELRRDKSLRVFGALLHNPDLWHLNRYSVSGAVSIGLFMSFVPLPFQMLLAAAAAIGFGCNLPLSVLAVWVSNPLTLPLLFYAAYRTGAWLLDHAPSPVDFEVSFAWLGSELSAIWQPFLLGCLVLGILSAALGNVAVRMAWRWRVIYTWRARRARRTRPASS